MTAPIDLSQLVMRRMLALALAALLAIAALGALRASGDIGDEVEAALALAGIVAQLQGARDASDDDALAALALAQGQRPLRHLRLQVAAADGRVLLATPAGGAGALDALLGLQQRLQPAEPARRVDWRLDRGTREPWTVTLVASPDSERREALAGLLQTLALVALALAALLLAMRISLRRALQPLAAIVHAIERIGREPGAARALPPMPIRELQRIADALARLDESLDRSERDRRALGRRLLTLQEDERSRLARELHDEFGQRLTALRADAAWLGRRLVADAQAARRAPDGSLLEVLDGMAARCAELQRDIRELLARLRPLGPAEADDGRPALDRLLALLRALVDGWAQAPANRTDYRLLVALRAADGSERPLDDAAAARIALPRELMLGVYRLSQEALTNVARHAQATRVELRLAIEDAGSAHPVLDWSLRDDGVGIADLGAAMRDGSGLAGMRERVWGLGGELHCASADGGRGLLLSARLRAEPAEEGAR